MAKTVRLPESIPATDPQELHAADTAATQRCGRVVLAQGLRPHRPQVPVAGGDGEIAHCWENLLYPLVMST